MVASPAVVSFCLLQWRKRELAGIHKEGCRCSERLRVKLGKVKASHTLGLGGGMGYLKRGKLFLIKKYEFSFIMADKVREGEDIKYSKNEFSTVE